MTAAQIGLLMSLMQVMRIFGSNLWGWIADYSQRRVMVLRITAMAAVVTFCGIFGERSFIQIFVVMLMVNTFTSAHVPLSEALMLLETRGDLTYYGRVRLWGSVGFIISVMVAGQLLDWYGTQMVPWICVVVIDAGFCSQSAHERIFFFLPDPGFSYGLDVVKTA